MSYTFGHESLLGKGSASYLTNKTIFVSFENAFLQSGAINWKGPQGFKLIS